MAFYENLVLDYAGFMEITERRRPNKMSVLVVDEEPAILAGIAGILKIRGVRALLARSVPEAIGIAERSYIPIDLILTDVTISGLSGPELFDRLKELRPDLRVQYMSATVD